jgi:hypothetical protein
VKSSTEAMKDSRVVDFVNAVRFGQENSLQIHTTFYISDAICSSSFFIILFR